MQMYMVEMEGVLYALSQFDTPEINFIRQHFEQVLIHLNVIIKNLERLETSSNQFWHALN